MKISFVDDEPEIFPNQYGGKARTIINLAKHFVTLDEVEKVTILSRTINDKRGEFQWEGIHFKKLEGYSMVKQITEEADSTDVLNVHTCSFTMPYLENRKSIIVNHLHDVIFATSIAGSHLDKAIGGRWDAIIAPSNFAANVLKNITSWSDLYKRVIVIPRAVDDGVFFEVPLETAYKEIKEFVCDLKIDPKKHPIIFFPHRINANKGEFFLPELCKNLTIKYPNLLILATFDNNTDNLKIPNLINLKWVPTDKMKYFYSISDLTISLSLLPESFSQICLESIACGTPVLCFKFGNLSDLSEILPGIKSCEPNHKAILSNVCDILENKEVMKKNIKESQKIIREEYNMNKISQTFISTYKNLLQRKEKIKYEFAKDMSKLEDRFFISPIIAVYNSAVYLQEFGNKLREIKLSQNEVRILDACLTAVTFRELKRTVKMNDSILRKLISELINRKIIIRG